MNTPAAAQRHAKGYVIDPGDPRWARLRELITQHSLKTGDFILSSGRTSKYLFQLRQTMMLPEGAALLGEIIVDYMNDNGIHCVGGLELGAVPLVSIAALASHLKRTPVDAFFVRKAAKAHGARERIDGHVRAGADVLLVDDVATSGGSIIKAMEGLNQESPGCSVRKALVVVDRQEGAAENLAKMDIELVSIFKRSDFYIDA
ncbi:MAG: orotate phosphoribosyltransferase [Methylocystis sp.]|nr:orotate phosphoribosyltransferase [Methylocystis sp.]